MRLVLLFVLIGFSLFVNAQSKKEQIEILNKRVDSLSEILVSERIINLDKSTEISELTQKITNLESSILSLNADVSKLTSELQQSKTESATKTQDLAKLQTQLKTTTDSLTLVQSELVKLKNENLITQSLLNNKSTEVLLIEGQTYKTVKIGNQTWMAENLNVSTFRNGDPIPQAKTNKEWELAGKNKKPAWCYYENNPNHGLKYGKLYNWYAISDYRGLAPEGWHIPANYEFNLLIKDNYEINSDKLKSKEEWGCIFDKINCISNGNNESGFNALPSGGRFYEGTFVHKGYCSIWWTSSIFSSSDYMNIFSTNPVSFFLIDYNHDASSIPAGLGGEYPEGLSVRLVKD